MDENGQEVEVEVFSQEEVDGKLNEIKTGFETKLNDIQTQKAELEAKINGTKEDHPNFKVLKEALDKKDQEISEFKQTYESDKKKAKTEYEDSIIKTVSKGNDDFQKKIKYHLENTVSGMKDDSRETHQKKIEAAIKLASDNSSERGVFDSVTFDGGGRGMDFNQGGAGGSADFSSNEKALGAKLGINEDDYKKYGSRVSKR